MRNIQAARTQTYRETFKSALVYISILCTEICDSIKGTVMQIEKALINDRLRISKVS